MNTAGSGGALVPKSKMEKLADLALSVSRDRILRETDEMRSQVLHKVALSGNSAGYIPGLVAWAEDRVRQMVLARADAYAEAFAAYGQPSDALAETNLHAAAQQIAAGTISGICGDLNLHNIRTGQHQAAPEGYVSRRISAAMTSALQQGVLKLRRQQAMAATGAANPAPAAAFPEQRRREDLSSIEMMLRIEKWRQSAAQNGGKLTQKEVAARLQIDLRAYSAAKVGKPRAKDHYSRIRTAAERAGII
jgi:hypothetical protein